jgi:hypothetical protein
MNPVLWRSAYVIALLSDMQEAHPVGLGCMGMSQFYGAADDSEAGGDHE